MRHAYLWVNAKLGISAAILARRTSLYRRRRSLEVLEYRQMLHGSGDHDDAPPDLCILPALDTLALADPGLPNTAPAAGSPLTSIPILHSLPTATAKIYLDFDGHYESVWGAYSSISTPVFDIDGDATTFSAAELTSMYTIWQRVSEDYAPFQIDVTTENPGDFSNGHGLRVSIGGAGGWLGSPAGGVSYVGSFTSSLVNTVYVFPDALAKNERYIAEASSHEAGHAFALLHQSVYDSNGVKTAEYNPGGNGWAPIMGVSYYNDLSTWYYGTSSNGATQYQDDMAIISHPANGFGYRPDDHPDTVGSGTPLVVSGSAVSGAGIIGYMTDVDAFSFSTAAGQINLTASVAPLGPNLNAVLELRTSSGTLVASANPTNSLSASIGATVAAGQYTLMVKSTGEYGRVGQYTISGNIVVPNQAPMLDVIDNQTIAEGSTLSLTAHATDVDLNALTFGLAEGAPAGASIDPISGQLTWTAGDDATAPFSITVVVTDNGSPNLSASRTFLVTVTNVAPTVDAGGPYELNEGQDLVLAALATDPVDPLVYSWDLNGDAVYSDATGASPTVSWIQLVALGITNGPNVLNARLRVDDGDGGIVVSQAATITIHNAPPFAAVIGPATALRGELLTFTLEAQDPSPDDQTAGFVFTINWGDGSPIQQTGGYSGSTITHAFNVSGALNISVTAKDQNGDSSVSATHFIQVDATRLLANEQNPDLVDLVWSGTSGSDSVQIEQVTPTTLRVRELTLNGTAVSNALEFSDITGRVIVNGQAGNDELDARGLAVTSATLDGGADSNTLYGGPAGDILIGGSNGGEGKQGNNVIIAGNGHNTIYGNGLTARKGASGGNNLIIGGSGQDTIYGNFGSNPSGNGGEGGQNLVVSGGGDDTVYASQSVDGAEGGHGSILIAGTTSLNVVALQAILSEWTSEDALAVKVASISGTPAGLNLNGENYLIPGTTVVGDGHEVDTIYSDSEGAPNWLFYDVDAGSALRVKSNDQINDLA